MVIFIKILFFILFTPVLWGESWQEEIDFSQLEKDDDLTNLKNDLGVELDYLNDDFEQKYFKEEGEKKKQPTEKPSTYRALNLKDEKKESSVKATPSDSPSSAVIQDESQLSPGNYTVFDVGPEEKELLKIAKLLEHRIPEKEWNELALKAKLDHYQVVEGDYLWKISRRLFGTGFYYSKIWSLNTYITNPHEIKPGMVLVFDSGDSTMMPQIQVGEFVRGGEEEVAAAKGGGELSSFGDETIPPWFSEKERLQKQGHYFQYASDATYEDIKKMGDKGLITEYERYVPPKNELDVEIPSDQYDQFGISKDSKIKLKFKEGYPFTTFVTSNLVQDLGEIDAARNETQFLHFTNKVYIRFNEEVKVAPGDLYSIYSAQGKVSYKASERSGYKYSIIGEVKAIRPIEDLWECEITRIIAPIQRRDRLTVYTPRIHKIIYTFNDRAIEAMVIGGFSSLQKGFSQGDVVYLDRGRADGLEVGNTLEFYGFRDQYTGKRISLDPTYKIGEAVVITLTDNFATVLIHSSQDVISVGTWAVTKSKEQAMLTSKLREKRNGQKNSMEQKALENLDIELNVDNMNEQLLQKADSVDLTEDELAELERQEREKSFIQHNEKDLKELERLENEITLSEAQLNEQKQDEDKILEKEDLNSMEKQGTAKAAELSESVNEIEKQVGRKYLDEDLNSSDNPYGLTKYDLEEIDELLDHKNDQSNAETLAKPRPEGNRPDEVKPEEVEVAPLPTAEPELEPVPETAPEEPISQLTEETPPLPKSEEVAPTEGESAGEPALPIPTEEGAEEIGGDSNIGS